MLSPRRSRLLPIAVALGAFLAGLPGPAFAGEDAPAAESAAAWSGEHCEVSCGRFTEDTCEVWDPAGPPSCSCVPGADAGAYTECLCADGSTPSACTCSEGGAPCDAGNPPDDCGRCQCQC